MSSQSRDSGHDDRGQPADREELRSAADPDPGLLERVLEETLSNGAVSHLEPVELRALAAVAKRYPGTSLTVDPIAVELVESILKTRFRGLDVSDMFWREVSQRIATTLYEAPDTQERLERLWSQLSELDI